MSTAPVRFADGKRCRVVSGRWISPFTNNVISDTSLMDIDHVVPLHWAWTHGADVWTRERREAFANDPANLLPVESALNRQKGDKGPKDWLPPAGQCAYIARFQRVVRTYGMVLSIDEEAAHRRLLEGCR